MIPETSTHQSVGGDGLFLFIALAVILVVAAEAAFVAFGGMVAMVGTVVFALLATGAVIAALLHTMDSDG